MIGSTVTVLVDGTTTLWVIEPVTGQIHAEHQLTCTRLGQRCRRPLQLPPHSRAEKSAITSSKTVSITVWPSTPHPARSSPPREPGPSGPAPARSSSWADGSVGSAGRVVTARPTPSHRPQLRRPGTALRTNPECSMGSRPPALRSSVTPSSPARRSACQATCTVLRTAQSPAPGSGVRRVFPTDVRRCPLQCASLDRSSRNAASCMGCPVGGAAG